MEGLLTDEVVLTEADFCRISRLVYDHCGINLHDGKKELVRARLAKLLRAGGFRSFPDYMEHILQNPAGQAFSEFIDVLSTNLTSFFREEQHFEYLEKHLLPRLIEKKQKEQNLRLRVWSAGCSSGEEPYSIAMTIFENLPRQAWDAKILATDISTRVLETACSGLYPDSRLGSVSPQRKTKFFVTSNKNGAKYWQVHPCLKEMVLFKYLNLMNDWPVKGPLDIIFCRNVMIYFDKPTQAGLVRRFYDILDSGGVLFTGHSESLTGVEHQFQYVQPTIYRKA